MAALRPCLFLLAVLPALALAADQPVVTYDAVGADPQKYDGKTVVMEKLQLYGGGVRRGQLLELQVTNEKKMRHRLSFPTTPEAGAKVQTLNLLSEHYPAKLTCRIQRKGMSWEALVMDVELIGPGVLDPSFGPKDETGPLKPLCKLIRLGAILRLMLSPDGKYLYVLDCKAPRILRVNLEKRALDGEVPLEKGEEYACLSPDGTTLYASAAPMGFGKLQKAESGVIQVIDAATLKLKDSFTIPFDPFEMEATDSGLLYISGGSNQDTHVAVVDTKQQAIVGKAIRCMMQYHLRMSADRTKLLLVESHEVAARLSGTLLLLATVPRKVDTTTEGLECNLGRHHGRVEFSPDGRFIVLFGQGKIFLTPARLEPGAAKPAAASALHPSLNHSIVAGTFVPERKVLLAYGEWTKRPSNEPDVSGIAVLSYAELERKRAMLVGAAAPFSGSCSLMVCEPKEMLLCRAWQAVAEPVRIKRCGRDIVLPGHLTIYDAKALLKAVR